MFAVWPLSKGMGRKVVEVRVTIYGKTTDYTFEDFEKLIYLK
jgi:hypothetical protein